MAEKFEMSGTNLIIQLPEEVDHHNAEKLKAKADRMMLEHHVRCIVFDFKDTVFMDSSGIGMIMGRYKNLRFMGGMVMAVRVNERIRKILTMSGIYKVMDIYEEIPEHWRWIQGEKA